MVIVSSIVKALDNMPQDEMWVKKWRDVIDFMETDHRDPSKYCI